MSESQSAEIRCWIGLGGHEVEVRHGRTLVGRHDSCHIVLDDPLASRRHASLEFDGSCLLVEDLGSVNGVIVNGSRVGRRTRLENGDQVRFGNQKVIVHLVQTDAAGRRADRFGIETVSRAAESEDTLESTPADDEATVVRQAEALGMLTAVADKVLVMGRGAEAERILQATLLALLERASAGGVVPVENLEMAGSYAVRLAEATQKASWLDYVFELYGAADRVMPGSVIERLYRAVRAVPGTRLDKLRHYITVLHAKAKLGPSQLFLVGRIEGLEQLVKL